MFECPICGACKAHRLWSITLKGSRTGKYNPLYFCKECDSFFQRPVYHEDDQALKDDLQWHLNRRSHHKNYAEKLILQLTRTLPNAKALLDIGCGIGTSVLVAKELGLSAQGVEPNQYAVRYANDNLSLQLIQSYFSADLFHTKFDIVIADNVLEHVPAPHVFIRDVFAILKPGGILYLAVPGRKGGMLRVIYSLLFPANRLSIFADNDVHINNFSRKSILKLIEPYKATLQCGSYTGAYIIQAQV